MTTTIGPDLQVRDFALAVRRELALTRSTSSPTGSRPT